MNSPDQFAEVAPFYDELMSGVPYVWWMAYLEALLDKFGASPIKVLDVACGTGNVTELAAAHGYQMTGIDLSSPMIEVAREKALRSGYPIRYEAQDVAALDLGETFDLAFSFFDSLNYVSDPVQLQRGFHQIAAHLEPGALFIFDLNTEYALANHMFDQKDLGRDRPLRYLWKSRYDADERLCRIEMKFTWTHEADERSIVMEHVQRAYTDDEIRSMLRQAGFEHLAVYQSYTFKPPRRATDRVHHVARLAAP